VSKFKDEFYDTPTQTLSKLHCWLRRRIKKKKVEWTLKEEIKNLESGSLVVYRKIKGDSVIPKLRSLLNSPQLFEDPKKYCSECFASFETLRVGFISSTVKWWIDSCLFKEGVYYLSGTLEVKWSIFHENIENIRIILSEMAKNPASSKIVAHLQWINGRISHIYHFDPLPLGFSTFQHDNAQIVDPSKKEPSRMEIFTIENKDLSPQKKSEVIKDGLKDKLEEDANSLNLKGITNFFQFHDVCAQLVAKYWGKSNIRLLDELKKYENTNQGKMCFEIVQEWNTGETDFANAAIKIWELDEKAGAESIKMLLVDKEKEKENYQKYMWLAMVIHYKHHPPKM